MPATTKPSLLVALLILLTACDPCAGTPTCSVSPRVSYTGHVVERATGRSVGGTMITFIRTGGVSLAQDTVSTTSGSDGFFTITANAKSAGTVLGRLHVAPAGRPAYDIQNLSLQTTTVNGDGGTFGRIVIDPYIMYIAQIQSRVGGPAVGAYAYASFTRTGGIDIEPSVINTQADPSGRFFLAPVAKEPGVVLGNLTITTITPANTYTIPVSIETRYQDEAVHDVAVVNVGSALLWVGEVYRRVTNEHVAGIRVDFVRTGGIQVTPSQFTTTTNSVGLFPIQPVPASDGELIGDITVHPPGGLAPFTVTGVRIHTAADDTVRLAGRYGYGAEAHGLLELRYRTTMTVVDPGTTVIFHRTGGPATHPDSSVDVVKQLGFAGVDLAADTSGDLIGNLEVRMGEPYGTDVISGNHFVSAFDDTQRFAGTLLVGRWFPQIGQLVDSVTHQSIPGATVTFTRTDGVNFSPNPYTTTPNADGYFALRPQPLADGDAVGNLTFSVPPPYANFTVQGVHLHTSMDDTLRFVGAWFIAPRK